MKNLESFGVQEMDLSEIKEINGGIPWAAIIAATALGAKYAFEKGETLGRALA